MECPKCFGMMEKVNFRDYEVDRCTNCHGLWFDLNQDEYIRQIPGSEAIDDGPAHWDRYGHAAKVKCPNCKAEMLHLVSYQNAHVGYENCPVCYGTFYDAGEFRGSKHEKLFDRVRDIFVSERW